MAAEKGLITLKRRFLKEPKFRNDQKDVITVLLNKGVQERLTARQWKGSVSIYPIMVCVTHIRRRSGGVFDCTMGHGGKSLNPIQDGGQKGLPYQYFPCNFYKRRISPKNFLTFSFNPFAMPVQNFKAIPSASPKL